MTCGPLLPSLAAGLLLACAGRSTPAEPQLHRSVLTLAPSDRQLQTLPNFEPVWFVSETDAQVLAPALLRDGFAPDLARDLASRLQREPATAHAWIVPDRALLARFSAGERKQWLLRLAGNPANITYRWPLALGAATLAALEAEQRWQEAVGRLRATAVPHGERLVFGDLFALEDAFASTQDRLDFYRIALGSDALLLKLRRESGQPLDAVAQAAWWQVNGRYRAIEPLLNAVAAIPDAPRLDLGHVLPLLPRAMLNTFPPVLGDDRNPGVDTGLLATAFFELHPTVEAETPGGLETWLARHCMPVNGPPRYGDLLVYERFGLDQWPYTAVYVAQGTAFGRRPTLFGPWQFLDLAEIGQLNPRYAGGSPRIFRLKTAVNEPGEPAFLPSRMPAAWRKNLALKPLPAGPWGRLWYYEVLLAPSSRFLEQLGVPDPDPVWTFDGLTRDQLLDAVATTAMSEDTKRELLALFAAATPDAAGRITVRPTPAVVLAVPREFRTRVFPRLLGGKLITDYAQHVVFPPGFSVDEWFDDGSLPATVRQAILQLVYPVGDRVYLSDLGTLFPLLGSQRERFSAYRAVLREPAVVV
ncbi:MAG TPA: hypothetical protein VHN79_08545, partial [Lacunisphaera sp.]|nr:hypothetical protein [Lacunisphaera sp.]